ncbi:MAG: tRNA (adenosine(37)-N6)-threonylcarbamoyltransferase complex ATPase subunit type 1 TsaE [Anaerolineae bacterium]
MKTCHLLLETRRAEATRAVGALLGRRLRNGDVLALAGDLGAGKTVLTQGLAAGMGIAAVVTSPTFVLVNRYQAPDGRVLQHADCYRLANATAEMWDIGLGDLISDEDILVIEWADRIPDLLPEAFLEVRLEYVDEQRRRLCFIAHGARYAELLCDLAAALPSGSEDVIHVAGA